MYLKYYKCYCSDIENIENYEKAKADNFKGWDCHHRLETHTSDGGRRKVDITMDELKALGMYYNRPAEELIFLTESEHRSLHMNSENNPMRNEDTRKKASEAHKGKHLSEETRKKISEARKGKCAGENNPMYGKHHTEESKRKIGEVHKGNKNMLGKHHSEEARNKMSEALKGRQFSEEHKKKLSEARKGKHLSEEYKKKISEAQKGYRWFNNGKVNIKAKECPDGFVSGMLKRK